MEMAIKGLFGIKGNEVERAASMEGEFLYVQNVSAIERTSADQILGALRHAAEREGLRKMLDDAKTLSDFYDRTYNGMTKHDHPTLTRATASQLVGELADNLVKKRSWRLADSATKEEQR